jgi:uncharacterized protein (UPF0332 family)
VTEDARYLAKARESLASAEADLAAGRRNSAANRAYYAAFQAAVAALIHADIRPDTGNWQHRFVMNQFSGRLIRRRKQISSALASTLNELFDYRTTADYMADDVSVRDARDAVRRALALVKEVSEAPGRWSLHEPEAAYGSNDAKNERGIRLKARKLIEEIESAILGTYPDSELELVELGPRDYRLIVKTDDAELVDLHEVIGDRTANLLVDHDIWVVVLATPKTKQAA